MSLIKKLSTLVVSGELALFLATAENVKAQSQKVAYWNFDEGSGTIVNDSTGNGNNGTLEGGVFWTTNSISGSALRFDGTGRISIPKTSSIELTEKVSIEAWVKRENNQDGIILSRNGPFFLGIRNNHIRGGVYTTPNAWAEIEGTNNLVIGQWYKLSMQYDGSSVKGFVNEVQDGTTPQNGLIPGSTFQPPYIGFGDGGHGSQPYFNGIIDEVKVYSSTIDKTPTQIKNISKQGDTVRFSFNSFGDRPYSIQSSINLIDWSSVTNLTGTINSTNTLVNLDKTNKFEFYRVKEE